LTAPFEHPLGAVEPPLCADVNEIDTQLNNQDLLEAVRAGLLGRSERGLFDILAAHTPVGVFVSTPEYGSVYVNDRWCELTGLTPEQAMGDGWRVALHPDDAGRVNQEWGQAFAEGRDSVAEYRFVRPDGSVSWIEGYAATVHDDDGRVVGWVGTCLDFTARKEAEIELARASERFRAAFDNAPIGIALITPEGRWIESNPALCRLLGYSEEELLELTIFDVTHPDDRAGTADRRRRQLAGEDPPARIEKRYVRSDGEVVWVAVTSTFVRDLVGAPLYSVAQIEDITDRVRAQRALEEAEERFRRAFDDAPIGMAIVSLDGRWLRVNDSLCELTGYSEAELLQLTYRDITHPDDLEKNVAEVEDLLVGRITFMRIEKRYVRPNGRPVWVHISSSLVRDADGKPLHIVSQIEDVTGRKRAETKLRDLAERDSLTGVLNRRRFHEELDDALTRLRRDGGSSALLLVDLDRFKLVNDTRGHKVGDDVLVEVASVLRKRLRARDVVGRIGGDEFAALLDGATGAVAVMVARELLGALHLRIPAGDAEVAVSASIGVVQLDPVTTGEAALIAADRALYQAKHAGRDRVAVG
jgi:diguanylate cyclase (GGDEF)-like protein/PAS domain S-box-containing protein